MRGGVVALALAALLVGGCVGGRDGDPPRDGAIEERTENAASLAPPVTDEVLHNAGDGAGVPITFTEPLLLTTAGHGYEPSIEVAPDGTIYVTAHKSNRVHEDGRLGSWLWYSSDGGETFREVESPASVHRALWAFEGEIAVDATGRLYFVDTYLEDLHLSRWSPSASGPAWDWSRPVVGTTGEDDRPWLAAHGDGIVYLISNADAMAPALWNVPGGTGLGQRYQFLSSADGGLTWKEGRRFPGSNWCDIAASKANDHDVFVACSTASTDDGLTVNTSLQMVGFSSGNRGDTWRAEPIAPYRFDEYDDFTFPSMTTDVDGIPYAAWIDGDRLDDRADQLFIGRRTGAGWEAVNATPFVGTFVHAWVSAGRGGLAAISFFGTSDLEPSETTEWHAYVLVTLDAPAPLPTWALVRLSPTPVAKGPHAPWDFFQNAIGPDNAINVAFFGNFEDQGLVMNTLDERYDVHYTRQLTGPNLAS